MKVVLVFVLLQVTYISGQKPAGMKVAGGSHLETPFTAAVAEVISSVYAELTAQEPKLVKRNKACEAKVDARVKTCGECVEDKCQGSAGPGAIAKAILNKVLLSPGKKLGNRIKNLGVGLGNIAKNIGLNAKDFALKGLKGIGEAVFNKLKQLGGLLKKLQGIAAKGFKKLKKYTGWIPGLRRRRAAEKKLDAKTIACFKGDCNAACGPFLDMNTAQDKICDPKLSGDTNTFLENVYDMTVILTAINTTKSLLNGLWVDASMGVGGYEALMKGTYQIQLLTGKNLKYPTIFTPSEKRDEFWAELALDYYRKYAASVVRPPTTPAPATS